MRDFVHVEDVASAIAATAVSGATGLVEIGSGVPTTVATVVDLLASASSARDQLVADRPGADDLTPFVADVDRLRHEMGSYRRDRSQQP